jgi:hypothetical protein
MMLCLILMHMNQTKRKLRKNLKNPFRGSTKSQLAVAAGRRRTSSSLPPTSSFSRISRKRSRSSSRCSRTSRSMSCTPPIKKSSLSLFTTPDTGWYLRSTGPWSMNSILTHAMLKLKGGGYGSRTRRSKTHSPRNLKN